MLITYLGGESELIFEKRIMNKAFFVLSKLDVPFRDCVKGEEKVSVFVPLYRRMTIEKSFSSHGLPFERGRMRGLPHLVYRYRKRWGIPVGTLILAIMLFMAQRVIWCVDISGNTSVPDKEIEELLEKLGCGVGDTYKNIDFDLLHNRFLMESESIAWISVNMNGNHANVQVREKDPLEIDDEEGYYNIVASEAGQIERIAAIDGKPVVDLYDTVLAGELLISGAISYKETFNRFESAEGSVYARVHRAFDVSVPLKQTVKVETGEKTVKNSIRFFNFDINLFLKGGIPYEFCDKIAVCDRFTLFDTVPLPLWVEKEEYREYEMKETTLTESEAELLAIKEYREKLSEVLGDGELISKNVTKSFDGDTYTISCSLYCIDDIAKKVPLLIGEENTENKETE